MDNNKYGIEYARKTDITTEINGDCCTQGKL
jgi:hypothetical protein